MVDYQHQVHDWAIFLPREDHLQAPAAVALILENILTTQLSQHLVRQKQQDCTCTSFLYRALITTYIQLDNTTSS